MNFQKEYLKKKLHILVFFLIAIALSFQHLNHWDVLDQVANADRFVNHGAFFPQPGQSPIGGVSVYFPGVAILGALLNLLTSHYTSHYTPHLLLICATFAALLFLRAQRQIALSISPQYSQENFWPIAIILSCIFGVHWLSYAVQFKPDSIAYLIGATCLLHSLRKSTGEESTLVHLGLGFLAGICLVFKQQYVAFIVGYLSFVLINRRKTSILFGLGLSVGATSVLLLLLTNGPLRFWTIDVLSDDGFLSFYEWARAHGRFGLTLIAGLAVMAILWGRGEMFSGPQDLAVAVRSSLNSPWIFIIGLSVLAAFSSSWKVGGNSGNTAFALMLLTPFICILLNRVNARLVRTAAWFAIAINIPYAAQVIDAAKKTDAYLAEVRRYYPADKCVASVVGSNTYFALRQASKECPYANYWAHALRDNSPLKTGETLKSFIDDQNVTHFFVESWPINKGLIDQSSELKVVFSNEVGLIALRN